MSATLENSQNIPKENSGHQVTRCGLGRNLEKERSSKQHPPVIFSQYSKSTRVSCVHFSSTWMSPVWNRIDKAGRAGVRRVGMERRNFQEISPSSASHSRKFEQDSDRRNFFQKKRTGPHFLKGWMFRGGPGCANRCMRRKLPLTFQIAAVFEIHQFQVCTSKP